MGQDWMAQLGITKWAGWTGMAALFALASLAEKKPAPTPPAEPKPAVSIDVAPLGYKPPGTFYLTYKLSSSAMGFFDNEHLLFTFRVGGLLQREPNDPAEDDDQQIRALLLDLKTGEVVRKTEWRMHDRSQYLWPFKDGKFLVRRRDSLFATDPSLELDPFMTFGAGIRAIQISSDRKLMVVETNEPEKLKTEPVEPRRLGTGEPVKVMIFPMGEKTPILDRWPESDAAAADGRWASGFAGGKGAEFLGDARRALPWRSEDRGAGEVPMPALGAAAERECCADGGVLRRQRRTRGHCRLDRRRWGAVAGSLAKPLCVGMVRFRGERQPVRV